MELFDFCLYVSAIVFALGFFGDRRTTTEETPAPATDAASEPTTPPAELPTITEPTEPATVTPAPAESTPAPVPDLSALTVTELRRLATAAAFPWRNHHGPNRHATKRELIAALS